MERSEVFERLNQVFCEVFDDDAITVTEETTAADVAGWDSLMHITLIAEVEEEESNNRVCDFAQALINAGKITADEAALFSNLSRDRFKDKI